MLRLLKMMLFTVYAKSSSATVSSIDKNFPMDIRTLKKNLGLDPQLLLYATCPVCWATYPPEQKSPGVFEWPPTCTFKTFPHSPSCDSPLTTASRVVNGESARHPIRPFPTNPFVPWLADLICRPGMLKHLAQKPTASDVDGLADVFHGDWLKELRMEDGRLFVDSPVGELHLVFALSIDFFNPLLNKISGKKMSSGSIALICLNLPPHLRHLPENVYVHGIIPLPHEPKLEEINHFERALVDDLLEGWRRGFYFSQTPDHLKGLKTFVALAMFVIDMQGRKAAGLAHHNHKLHPCPYCHVKHSEIDNIDCQTFRLKTGEEVLAKSVRWRDADNQSTRNELFSRFGVRWSELNRLPYWDPVQCVIIDGAHAHFLGSVQHHCRQYLGFVPIPNSSAPPSQQELAEAREIMNTPPVAISQVRKFKVAILHALCHERGVNNTKGVNGKELARILWVCMLCLVHI
jgi:hypothetical protein